MSRASLLADAALSVVEGQIDVGTAGVDAGGGLLAWASQPGMIRTYGTDGKMVTVYKLYSSDTLQQSKDFNLTSTTIQNEEIPTSWKQSPADFVDLNSPELTSDPNGLITPDPNNLASKYVARFPIIDGNNLKGGLINRDGSTAAASVLGYDTDGDGTADIEGFSVQQPATYDSTKPLAPDNNPVPMPVRWIYMLQNGELHTRDLQNGTIVDATTANPVVGRIAFWTDDDTCKLNVNTASEGTFWDRPWVQSPTEENFSTYLPAQNEFQMYPGHPAKTCLSTVLGASWLWPVDAVVGTTSNYSKWKPYYDLTPRVSEASTYGSAGGTQAAPTPAPGKAPGVPYDTDRLYASLDEIMFKPGTTSGGMTRPARNDASNNAGGAAITPQFLETTRFFLTASNRAPEVTLFNTPRVSLWPIQADPGYRTAKDQLLAFCSTIPSGSTYQYYFQRATATHNVPGAGTQAITPMSCESPTMDMALTDSQGRQRNQQLYGYLQQLLSMPVPGLGGSFQTKYTSSVTGQIITEMLDQIRSGVNTTVSDPTDSHAYSYTQPQPAALTVAQQQQYYTDRHGPLGNPGAGQVVPLQTSGGRGFGRFNTIVEAAVVLFRVTNPEKDTKNPTETRADIGACLILEPFNPTPGFPPWSPDMRIEVSGLDGWQIAGADGGKVNLGFPTGPSTNIVNAFSSYYDEGANTEFNGLATMFFYNVNGSPPQYKRFAPQTGNASLAADPTIYPFSNAKPGGADTGCSIMIVPPVIDPKSGLVTNPSVCTLYGAPLTIKIYSNPTSGIPPELVQTLSMPFPTPAAGYKIQVPTYTHTTNIGTSVATFLAARTKGSDGGHVDDFTRRGLVGAALVDPGDVVRSVIVDPAGLSKGDYRVIAALANVPAGCFIQHPFYDQYNQYTSAVNGPSVLDPVPANADFNRKFAHNLRTGFTPEYGGFGWYNYNGVTNVGYYLDKYDTPYSYPPANTPIPPYPNAPNIRMSRKSAYRGTLVPDPNVPSAIPAYYRDSTPGVAPGLTGAFLGGGNSTTPGDWDTGIGLTEDGAYVNKPDETNGQQVNVSAGATDTTAYFNRGAFSTDNGQGYSPNRQICSAVAFGSLPTGIDPDGANIKPWQTLLFCANPPAGFSHPGFGSQTNLSASGYPAPPYTTVPDHAVLDLFTMPTVEPYAISEPLSTQGKVNMNYQIAPFTYIRRDTGVRAVMKSTWLTAIPSNAAETPTSGNAYKQQGGATYASQLRYAINPDEQGGTLRGFEDRFNSGDIFRSASEICGLPLVPKQITGINQNLRAPITYPTPAPPTSAASSDISNWWNGYKLTGDNLREAPYGDLYPRLTTKSNTFTVHVRVQALKKALATSAATFVDPMDSTNTGPKDVVTAEYRGSFQIERYVDPNASTTGTNPFPDYIQKGISATPIGSFYKFRTINTKQF